MLSVRSVILIVIALHTAKSKALMQSLDNESTMLEAAISEIIENNFSHFSSPINVITAVKDKQRAGDLIDSVLSKNSENFVVTIDIAEKIDSTENRKRKINVILLDNIESFGLLAIKIDPKLFRFSGYYLIVLIDGIFENIEELFATLWRRNIYNVNVIYNDDKIIRVMTFLPYEGSRCGDTSPKVLDSYVNGSFAHGVEWLYPDKFIDLQNCSIGVSTFEDKLSVVKKQIDNTTYELSGFDIELLREIAKTLNFSTTVRLNTEAVPYGTIYKNGTVDGALGEVANGKSQIGISYFLYLERLKVVDSSIVFYGFPRVFVMSPGRKISTFEKLLQPFKATVWTFMLIILIMSLIVMSILRFMHSNVRDFLVGKDIKHPVTNLIAAVLGGSQPKLPKSQFSRFILMKFLIFCLVMRNAYQGALFKFLQSETSHDSPSTIDEMVQREFDFYMLDSQVSLFENQPKVSARIKIMNKAQRAKFHKTSIDSDDRIAFVSTMTDVIDSNEKNKNNFVHNVCKENIATINVVMYFTKDFYLSEAINKHLYSFISSGIMNYIIEKNVDMRFWNVEEEKKGPQILFMKHLRGAFYLWMIFTSLCVLVFIVELSKTVFRFHFNFLE